MTRDLSARERWWLRSWEKRYGSSTTYTASLTFGEALRQLHATPLLGFWVSCPDERVAECLHVYIGHCFRQAQRDYPETRRVAYRVARSGKVVTCTPDP